MPRLDIRHRSLRRRARRLPWFFAIVATVGPAALVASACGEAEPMDLNALVVRDSVYVVPETGVPYTGPVFREFPDEAERLQLEGALRDGEWDGEIRVYHPNGRIRYMGSFDMGRMCGPWTENADSTGNESVYEDLLDEIESLGMYPPCPET